MAANHALKTAEDTSMPLSVGKTIRILRDARALSASEVAKRAGISLPYLSLVETGRRSPSIEKLRSLSDALGVPTDFLLIIASGKHSSLTSNKEHVQRLLNVMQRLANLERELQNEIKPDSQ